MIRDSDRASEDAGVDADPGVHVTQTPSVLTMRGQSWLPTDITPSLPPTGRLCTRVANTTREVAGTPWVPDEFLDRTGTEDFRTCLVMSGSAYG